jgi:hypothetical protein
MIFWSRSVHNSVPIPRAVYSSFIPVKPPEIFLRNCVNRNIRDISTKLSNRWKDPAWEQETRPVVFILGDKMRTFISNRVTKCNETRHKTYFKAYTKENKRNAQFSKLIFNFVFTYMFRASEFHPQGDSCICSTVCFACSRRCITNIPYCILLEDEIKGFETCRIKQIKY